VLMTPILEGLDGVQKMSKSLGNAIGIQEPPGEMYGKLMSVSDELMWKYYTFLTDLRGTEIEAKKVDVAEGRLHPMQAKKDLAWGIVRDFHGAEAADAAAESWAKQFQQRTVDLESLEEVQVRFQDIALVQQKDVTWTDEAAASTVIDVFKDYDKVRLDKLLVASGLAASASEGTRKIKEGAVRVNGEIQSGTHLLIKERPFKFHLRLGKKQKVAVIV
jgi:tyrosyl-tRNA synthetase